MLGVEQSCFTILIYHRRKPIATLSGPFESFIDLYLHVPSQKLLDSKRENYGKSERTLMFAAKDLPR
jgi:hypothetical protein